MDRYNEDGEIDPDGTLDEQGNEIPADVLQKEANREGFRLRKITRENEALKEQVAGLLKAEAFRGAGLNPADEKLSYFMKGYEGDMTAEAVKAEAVRVGLLAADTPVDPAATPEAQQALSTQEKIIGASTGAQPPATGIAALEQAQQAAFESGGGNNTAALMEVLRQQGFPIADSG